MIKFSQYKPNKPPTMIFGLGFYLRNHHERLMLDGDVQENWQSALDGLGLSLVEVE